MGVTEFVFEISAAKAKIWGVFAGLSYCHGTFLRHKNDSILFSYNWCLIWYHNIAVKDGAYYCYCAYVLRISRYSGFLSMMLTNTGIFLHRLKLSGESRS